MIRNHRKSPEKNSVTDEIVCTVSREAQFNALSNGENPIQIFPIVIEL